MTNKILDNVTPGNIRGWIFVRSDGRMAQHVEIAGHAGQTKSLIKWVDNMKDATVYATREFIHPECVAFLHVEVQRAVEIVPIDEWNVEEWHERSS